MTEAAKKRWKRGLPEGDPRHGTPNGYRNWGCRCEACKEGHLQYNREYAAGRPKKAKKGLPDGDPRHGTNNGYTNHGCRCERCKYANSLRQTEARAKRQGQGLAPDDPRHGTYNAYTNFGCRCEECKLAHYEHNLQSPKGVAAQARRAERDRRRSETAAERYFRDEVLAPAHEAFQQAINDAKADFDHAVRLAADAYTRKTGQLVPDTFRALASGDSRHGTLTGYTGEGCRCAECRRAMADYQLVRRERDRQARRDRAESDAVARSDDSTQLDPQLGGSQ